MGKNDRKWYKKTNDIVLFGRLKLSDLECPCCKRVMVNPDIYSLTIEIEAKYGDEIIITSAYRCEQHNIYVGGVERSRHCYGEAIDLQPRHKGHTVEVGEIEKRYKKQFKVIRYKEENYLHIQTR